MSQTILIETTAPVMVTGATGYVAGWIVKELLDAGLTVHAPVRNPDDAAKVDHLRQLAAASKGHIKFFKADLLDVGSYHDAMAGCEVVFHTASPFKIDVKDPQKELVDPALLGTRNVLEEANRTPSVKRVVLTSSCAAIYGDNADLLATPNGVFTEEIWNTSSSLQHNPYSYSKTVAEKEAWSIARAQARWNLVVVNPSLVIGPSLNPDPTSESFAMVKQMGDGTLRMGAPRWGFGVVDVRDLGKAHLAAAFVPTAAGRHIINGHNTDLLELAKLLLPKYGRSYPIPPRAMPKWMLWMIGPMAGGGMTRRAISRNVDLPWKGDNRRGVRELGLEYRPLQTSMNDMFQQMIDRGVFAKA
ncbi:NAD-dependent epimerase/dehydratase family protein [Dyella flava]|uniref:NAD-dependent epimerase/dehydratase family protein n=1 Tax=Dyella flava TaxID=1920170 RepID=A0ABS2K091_9GAMM|nr:NAD-dependent epimerase/dehydratase family protein [Dyella flava]MBM7124475.1 NAD-dependent epimerase/dehydratase family protein [Dyella flava]GLQ51863.1 dihydroflavonol-4-reductase [Dyella flava]